MFSTFSIDNDAFEWYTRRVVVNSFSNDKVLIRLRNYCFRLIVVPTYIAFTKIIETKTDLAPFFKNTSTFFSLNVSGSYTACGR